MCTTGDIFKSENFNMKNTGAICHGLNFRELSDLIFLLISFRVRETFSQAFSRKRSSLIPEAYLGPPQHLRSSSL